ncbi:M16 family metallopeptidase [Pseudomonas laurylsulfatiphila]|uniref:M16 family metallopeptidase n=1 Tax=Pseudomonas laurylsulfatiphila TaxID=2011015 RepID=UPI00215DFBE8|nr:pitrilysin family protein [Pseudomonas laurylsulfatiphila]UVM04802.1 insulinase family protein [Pseudomonas laurylsulfatiphila]
MQLKYPTTPTKELTLDNGLKIITAEISQASDAYIDLVYKVSSCNELPENAGINITLASVLFSDNEHTSAPDENEHLSFHFDDFTTYRQRVRLADLDEAFSQLATMMSAPKMTEASLQAVIQETNSNRAARDIFISNYLTPQEVTELLYPFSGYSNNPQGTPTSLSRLDLDQLQQWHQRWYMPNNATLIVVGNVNTDNILSLAEQHFSAIPHKPLEVFKYDKEAAEPGKRHIEVSKDTNEPLAIMAFNLPDFDFFKGDPNALGALDIIEELLKNHFRLTPDGSGAARKILNQNAGIFFLSVKAQSADQTPCQLESGLRTYLNKLKRNPIDAQSLEHARENILTRWAGWEHNPSALPYLLTTYHYAKLPLDSRAQRYQALLNITPMDIQNFANTYFTEQRMTTAHIFPMAGSPE